MNIQTCTSPKAQQGYILLMSVVFLFMLVATAGHFLYRTTENTSMTGISRDSSKSLLLAESAMDHLRGRFVRNRLNTDNTTRVAACLVDATTSDACESGAILSNISDPEADLFDYMYFMSNATAVDQNVPQLLQRIADGESRQTAASQLSSGRIVNATTPMRINDLFNDGSNLQPMLYKLSANSRLIDSAETSWDDETSPEKAAAWIEIIVNPTDPGSINLVVQAVGQVGKAKSYVQRLAGTFSAGSLIGTISPLTEASNIVR